MILAGVREFSSIDWALLMFVTKGAVQWILCGFGAVTSLLVLTLLPETAHSTGMRIRIQEDYGTSDTKPRFLLFAPNPLGPLSLLLKPTILLTVRNFNMQQ